MDIFNFNQTLFFYLAKISNNYIGQLIYKLIWEASR